jgi:hypothetical protein
MMSKLRVIIGIILIILSELGTGFAGTNEFQEPSIQGKRDSEPCCCRKHLPASGSMPDSEVVARNLPLFAGMHRRCIPGGSGQLNASSVQTRADRLSFSPVMQQQGEYGFTKFESTALQARLDEHSQRGCPLVNERTLSGINFRNPGKSLRYRERTSYFGGLSLNEFANGYELLWQRYRLERRESFSVPFGGQMSVPGTPVPQTPYARLKSALGRYRTVAERGGWPTVPAGPLLKKGDSGRRVAILRMRLISTDEYGYLTAKAFGLFDDDLEQAIRNFQERHGLEADGIVGPKTFAALNVPVEQRLRQMRINMERWRNVSRKLGERYILINSANFELKMIENEQTIASMRAVVGRPDRPTPVLSSEITHIVFNPYWYIPTVIVLEDLLPKIKKDEEYLNRENIEVFKRSNGHILEVDQEIIDWSTVTATTFNYKLRQDPGPQNALGRVKFIFPNNFSIYIHDTPARELFRKAKRSFSSGCIRIEQPVDLAEHLLRSDSGDRTLTREEILARLDSGVRRRVRLPEPIPVHIVYCTAWVDDKGSVQFRDDIYGRDMVVRTALNEGQSNR